MLIVSKNNALGEFVLYLSSTYLTYIFLFFGRKCILSKQIMLLTNLINKVPLSSP